MSATSAIERYKRLKEESEQLLAEAKMEALAAAKAAVGELNTLGFNYRLEEANGNLSNGHAKGIKGRRDPQKACRVCGKKGHDGRFHRWEKTKKR